LNPIIFCRHKRRLKLERHWTLPLDDWRWLDINGSFRIEKQTSKVMVYIQGPVSGLDLMVVGLQIFPVDRHAKFRYMKMWIDNVRSIVLLFLHIINKKQFLLWMKQNVFWKKDNATEYIFQNEMFNKFIISIFQWCVCMYVMLY
jgi:hypothetical protein